MWPSASVYESSHATALEISASHVEHRAFVVGCNNIFPSASISESPHAHVIAFMAALLAVTCERSKKKIKKRNPTHLMNTI